MFILVLNIKSVDEFWYCYRIHFHIEASWIKATFLTSLRHLVLLLFMKYCSITVPQVTTTTIELIVPIETKGFQRRGKVGCSVICPFLHAIKIIRRHAGSRKYLVLSSHFWEVIECLNIGQKSIPNKEKIKAAGALLCHMHLIYGFSAGIYNFIFE